MAQPAARHIAYRPETLYRNVLTPADRASKRICTVWPESITLPFPAGGLHVTIPGRPDRDGEPQSGAFYLPKDGGELVPTNRYGFVSVGPGIERDDLGNVRTLALLSISSRRNAMDVIGLSDAGKDEVTGTVMCAAETTSEMFEKGYFVPVGDVPNENELVAAEGRCLKFLRKALAAGDRVWNNTQKLDAIPPEAIMAARFLGKARVWAPSIEGEEVQLDTIPCPVCKKHIERGMKKCLACGEWIGYEADGTAYAVNDPERKARLLAAKIDGKGKPKKGSDAPSNEDGVAE